MCDEKLKKYIEGITHSDFSSDVLRFVQEQLNGLAEYFELKNYEIFVTPDNGNFPSSLIITDDLIIEVGGEHLKIEYSIYPILSVQQINIFHKDEQKVEIEVFLNKNNKNFKLLVMKEQKDKIRNIMSSFIKKFEN